MAKTMKASIFLLILLLIHVLPALSSAECTCDDPNHLSKDPKPTTLKYRAASILAILLAGAAGVVIPVLGKRIPAFESETDVFFMIKAFAAGVIIATAFIHILPDAFESLTSPCLKGAAWEDFPMTGFVAMMGALGTLMIDSAANAYFGNKGMKSAVGDVDGPALAADSSSTADHLHVHTHASHGHAHGAVTEGGSEAKLSDAPGKLTLIRNRVTSQVLEFGIMVHSVIIGVALGTSQSLMTIKTLMTALSFHQFFEGMGLGGCIVQAMFNTRATVTMVVIFSLTTPLGVAIGLGISHIYNEDSPTSLIIQGLLQAISAGILIYMALVDLLAADFMNARVQANLVLQLGCNVSLLLGAGCMSVLAKWA